jgi:hypothetical protein
MKALHILAYGLWGLVLLGAMPPAWAIEPAPGGSPPSLTVQQDISLPGTTGPVVTDNAITQAYKTWSAQITPSMNFVGGVFSPNWQRRRVGGNLPTLQEQADARGNYRSLQVPVQLFYGLTPRMSASVTVPFVRAWADDVGPLSKAGNFTSVGDSSLTLRYMFLNGSPTATTVTGYASVLCPTGQARHLEPSRLGTDQTGLGAFSFTWGFDVFKFLPEVPVLLYGNFWYTNFADGNVNGARTYYPDQVTVNLAMEIPFNTSPSNRWALLFELLSTWDGGRMLGPQANQASSANLSALPGIEYLPTSWFSMAAGVRVSLLGKNTPYNYTPMLALFLNY